MSYSYIPKVKAQSLIKKIKNYATEYYCNHVGNETEICSFGIAADSDISGFIVQYNTKIGVQKIIENHKEFIRKLPEHKDNPSDNDKWSIHEWISEIIHENFTEQEILDYGEIENLMEKLSKKADWHLDDEKNIFAKYKEEMFDIFCEVLKQMKEENVFKNISDDFFLLFEEGDNGVYATRERSLEKILTPNQLKEYLLFE
jgi:hypothetical protein